ncbi:MAG: hypothetical protein R2862_09240 [Thermoanaerobaculia bacterium]
MGTEVLISGGTIATTRIATSTGFDGSFEDSWSPDRFVALGSVALIIGSDGLRNTLLYSVPLASGPLVQLTDLCQPHCQGEVWIRRLGARAVFPVQRPGGPELWATEGSTSSTRKIADFCDLPCDGQLRPIASDGERLLFAAPGEHGSFWMTSGTIADTFSITDSSPASVTAPVGSASNRWAESGLGVAFPGRDAAHGAELWIGSLASRTSNLILDLNTTVPRNGRRFGAGTGGSANFILRDDSGLQYRVWHIDSPFDAVTLVEGLALPAIETYGPNDQLYALNGVTAYVAPIGGSLWSIDEQGVAHPLPGPTGLGSASQPLQIDDSLLLIGSPTTSTELWSTDGTVGGTVLKQAFGPQADLRSRLFRAGEHVLLFRGSTGGLQLVRLSPDLHSAQPIATFPSAYQPGPNIVTAGARAYFSVPDYGDEQGLWMTDGTSFGTERILESDQPLTVMGAATLLSDDYVLFQGPYGGAVLGRRAGTSAVLQPVKLFPDADSTIPTPMESIHGRLLFPLASDGERFRLWASDGTEEGTEILADFSLTVAGFLRDELLRVSDDKLLFVGYDYRTGSELWTTDGTRGGT